MNFFSRLRQKFFGTNGENNSMLWNIVSGNAEWFHLPRTRHGFHGDKGYAKIGGGHTRMYLHFMVA